MYDGYIWRLERDQQADLALAFLNLQSQGAKAQLEDLMGRPPYPVLRALQEEPTIIQRSMERTVQTTEEVQRDLADLKEVFKDELSKIGQEVGVALNPASQSELDSLLTESGVTIKPGAVKPGGAIRSKPTKYMPGELEKELRELKEVFKDELEDN